MSIEFNDLHYKIGDIYKSSTDLYKITGHKPCSSCHFLRQHECEGKALFTHIMSKHPYEVCGIQEGHSGKLEKVYPKAEITNIRW